MFELQTSIIQNLPPLRTGFPLMATLSPPPSMATLSPPPQLPFIRLGPKQPTLFPPFLSLRQHHHRRSSFITNAGTSSSKTVATTNTAASAYTTWEEHDAVNIAEDVTQVLFSTLPRSIILYPVTKLLIFLV